MNPTVSTSLWPAPGTRRRVFSGEGTGLIKRYSFGHGDDLVVVGVNDQEGLGPLPDLVDIAQPFVFLIPQGLNVHPDEPQKGRGPGKAAFNDQAGEFIGVGGGQFQGRGAAQGTPHDRQGPVKWCSRSQSRTKARMTWQSAIMAATVGVPVERP